MFSIEQFDISDWIVLEDAKPIFMIKDQDMANRLVKCLNSHAVLVGKLIECMVIIGLEAKFNKEHREALIEKHDEIKVLLDSLAKPQRV